MGWTFLINSPWEMPCETRTVLETGWGSGASEDINFERAALELLGAAITSGGGAAAWEPALADRGLTTNGCTAGAA